MAKRVFRSFAYCVGHLKKRDCGILTRVLASKLSCFIQLIPTMLHNTSSFAAASICNPLRVMTSLQLTGTTLCMATLATTFCCVALAYVVSTATAKPETHPSLRELEFAEGSRLARLKAHAQELYPIELYGPGHSIRLTKGRVQYWLIGPEEGTKVVLIHGLTTPSLVWKYVTEDLAYAGFRLLIYDLYGRGYSEGPDAKFTPYDTDLYVTQLALLMQAIGWRKARLVGMSMGGGIATAFAAKLPWLVDFNIVLIGSAGIMEEVKVGLATSTLSSVLVRRLRHSAIGKFLFTLGPPPAVSSTLAYAEQERKKLKSFFKLQSALLPGYNSALVSSVYFGPVTGLEREFKHLGEMKNMKVQLVWGTKDKIVPFKYVGKIKALIPYADLMIVENAGHVSDLFINHTDLVTKGLIEFLHSQPNVKLVT
ncbi:Alpha/Beta hydrolase protein [Rhizoctonia solani]|nr:Alpha/Beta hydrolase protein [Rhizoctonia solani]